MSAVAEAVARIAAEREGDPPAHPAHGGGSNGAFLCQLDPEGGALEADRWSVGTKCPRCLIAFVAVVAEHGVWLGPRDVRLYLGPENATELALAFRAAGFLDLEGSDR